MIKRDVAVHFWPVDRNAPSITCSSARSMSASSRTTAAFLPPISACTGTPRARRGSDAPPDSGGAGEGDGLDVVVAHDGIADRRAADDQIEYPCGQPRVGERLSEPNRQQWDGARGLPHHGVAIDQGGGDLPRRDGDGEVERGDDTNHADGLAGHQDLLSGTRRGEHLAGLPVTFVAVVAQDLRGPSDLTDAFGLRLSLLGCQLESPGPGVALHQVCSGQQYRTALMDGQGRPRRRGLGRGGDGGVDVRDAGTAAVCHHDARAGRIHAAQSVAATGRPLTRDEVPDGLDWGFDRGDARHDRNAAWPVNALPMDSRCISDVPS